MSPLWRKIKVKAGQFSSVQFILFALINHDYNNYNNNYAFGRQSGKLFCLFKRLP